MRSKGTLTYDACIDPCGAVHVVDLTVQSGRQPLLSTQGPKQTRMPLLRANSLIRARFFWNGTLDCDLCWFNSALKWPQLLLTASAPTVWYRSEKWAHLFFFCFSPQPRERCFGLINFNRLFKSMILSLIFSFRWFQSTSQFEREINIHKSQHKAVFI